MMTGNDKKVSIKDRLNDYVCRTILILEGLAYLNWFGILWILYPLQTNADGTYNVSVITGIILAFVVLGIFLFLLNRLYEHRLYQIRSNKSKSEFRSEMKDLEQNWKLIKERNNIEDKYLFDYEKEVN